MSALTKLTAATGDIVLPAAAVTATTPPTRSIISVVMPSAT